MKEDIVRVIRIIEYVGPRSWVEYTVNLAVHGQKDFHPEGGKAYIRAATLGNFPDIVETAPKSDQTKES